MLEKPAYGLQCNNCGKCCEVELCPLAAALWGRWDGPCPALLPQHDGTKVCGLVAVPETLFPAKARRFGVGELKRTAAILVGAGLGCDWALAGERDPAITATLKAKAEPFMSEARRAIHVWGIEKLGRRVGLDA